MSHGLRRSVLNRASDRARAWWPNVRLIQRNFIAANRPIWGTIPPQTDSILAGAIAPLDLSTFLNQGLAPLTFAAAPLPAGLSIDVNTGIVTGTPTTIETPLVTATATNDQGTDQTTFTWTITA